MKKSTSMFYCIKIFIFSTLVLLAKTASFSSNSYTEDVSDRDPNLQIPASLACSDLNVGQRLFKASSSTSGNSVIHSLWMPNLFSNGTAKFDFTDGQLVYDENGAELFGTLNLRSGGGAKNNTAWGIYVKYDQTDIVNPKLELGQGQTQDLVNTWVYYMLNSSQSFLYDLNDHTDIIALTHLGNPFQIGLSAGGKDLNELSASGWLNWSRNGATGRGDININIEDLCPPECLSTSINGGSIDFAGPYNPEQTNTISNTQLPTSPFAALGFEYIWLQSEVNVPNVVGNSSWSVIEGSENLTELQVSGLLKTMYFIRCARIAGCDNYWGETNTVEVTVDPCLPAYISGGSIDFAGPYNPEQTNTISNTQLPTSPFAALGFEYIWLQSEVNVPNVVGNSSWSIVKGSENLTELQVSGLLKTMYFIRCARIAGCDKYWGETNTVEVTVAPCLPAYISGGSIDFAGPYNPEQTNTISNTQLPTSPFAALGFEYIWLQSEVNVPNVVGNSSWSIVKGSENLTELQVSGLLKTMYFIRCARIAGCDKYWGETNTVEVAGFEIPTAIISGGGQVCGPSGTASINISLTGISPFTIIYSNGKENVTIVVEKNDYSFEALEGTYSLVSVSDVNYQATLSGKAIVTVADTPTASISGGGTICNSAGIGIEDEVTATVQVDLTGTAPFNFKYLNGKSTFNVTTNKSTYTFEATTGIYSLLVLSDANCDGIVSGEAVVNLADTPTASISGGGTICNSAGIGIEDEATATVQVKLTGIAPFNFKYLNGKSIINVTTNKSTYTFEATAGTYSLLVLSDANCDGIVSGEAIVTLADTPTASISGGGTICNSNGIGLDDEVTATVQVELTGTAPFNFKYLNGKSIINVTTNKNTYTFEATAGIYSLLVLSDANCDGIVSGEAVVNLADTPTASISGGGTICNSAGIGIGDEATAAVQVKLTGTAPFNFKYLNGKSIINVTTNKNTYTFEATAGTYSLLVLSDVNCDGIVSGEAIVTLADTPTASISGGGTICNSAGIGIGDEGTATVQVTLTGIAPFNFKYSNGKSIINVTTNKSIYTFEATAGAYSLLVLSDANCDGIVSGEANITVADAPTASISGGGTICDINERADIIVDFTGTAPWTVAYKVNGQSREVETSNSKIVLVSEVGDFKLVSVTDSTCSGTTSGSASVVLIPSFSGTIILNEQHCSTQEILLEVENASNHQIDWGTNGTGQLTIIDNQTASYLPELSEVSVTFSAKVITTCEVVDLIAETDIISIDPSFVITPEIQEFVTNVNYTFTPEYKNGDNYFWNVNDVRIDAQVLDYVFEVSNDYTISLTIEKSGCEFSESIEINVDFDDNLLVQDVFDPQSINFENNAAKVYEEGIENDIVLSISPNPASSFLKIEVPGLHIDDYLIVDMMGKSYESINNNNTLSIDRLKPGVYVLQLRIGNELKKIKFLKE